jgi:hypothetical protein
MAQKPNPVVGMKVKWIDPNSDPRNRQFIIHQLMEGVGECGLTILSVEEYRGYWLVNIAKDGIPVLDKFLGNERNLFNWHYLEPLV